MRALRRRSASEFRPAALIPGLAASFLVLSCQSVAYQDLVSYLAQRSGVDQTWRRHVASLVRPQMTMASFALARPMPREEAQPQRVLARFDAGAATGANPHSGDRLVGPAVGAGLGRAVVYPQTNRDAKGDLLVERARLRPSLTAARPTTSLLEAPADLTTIARFTPDPAAEPVDTEHSPLALGGVQLAAVSPDAMIDDRSQGARLGLTGPAVAPADVLSPAPALANGGPDEPWADGQPGEESRFATELVEDRAGIAISGEGPLARAGVGFGAPALPLENEPFRVTTTHEPVAGFDPILGAFATDRRGDRPGPALSRVFRTPAPLSLDETSPERQTRTGHPILGLELSGTALARAQKCLAEAVYWEARSEPERGQMAVAQVVVNRAVSGFYPRDICGVVYQNAHRYLACQFTFACEGRRSLVATEPESWTLASRIARDMLAGRTWLAEVGHATHYHATYVRPWWARSMNRLQQIGVHVFYRPRQWGPLPPQVQLAPQPGHQS
ncbi:MAG: cell wall hydrolase [Phreatobacter sp.]